MDDRDCLLRPEANADDAPNGDTSQPATGERGRLERLYGEIRTVAGRLFERERAGHTLQPTAVANEAWIRLMNHVPATGDGPDVPLIANVVRNVLVDHARRRSSQRRGGDRQRTAIDPDELTVREDPEAMIIVGDAIESLATHSPRAASVVELRFIAGCDEAEVALLLGCSRATVGRDWRTARLWLRRALAEHGHVAEIEADGEAEGEAGSPGDA